MVAQISNLKHLSHRVSESPESGSGSGFWWLNCCQGLWSSEGLPELEDLLPRRLIHIAVDKRPQFISAVGRPQFLAIETSL